ncbi:30S ribosomal protein S20 [Pirellulimonas nuda]|uniref:Small ribosomal subunit protein bS20 n=2 Tax=Pirellulimonas nuda TaxID=2528009 RepID=A0A518D802_9BACT|nr:30S ribosomal protein S20 [Pirellulimonas nuda]QDU87607.1 30S ribosomal protein S20 [Pirellulimonas nuda]
MPNSAGAKKRLRQSIDRNARNRAGRSALRTQIKKTRAAIAAGDVELSSKELIATQKKLDQAAAKNLIHANAAARTKSRLSKAVKALKQPASA